MTIQLDFTPEICTALNQERYDYPDPIVQRRMETLWLKSHDLPHAQIAELAGVSENTLRDYFRLYQEGGLAKLKARPSYRPLSALQTQAPSLEAHFREHPPATIKDAQHTIEQLTGLKRSAMQVRHFLHDKLGMRCRKVGMLPILSWHPSSASCGLSCASSFGPRPVANASTCAPPCMRSPTNW